MKKLYSVLLILISVTLFAQTYTFTTFNTNNSGIAANNVNDFKMSSSGTLWIATNNGLSKMVGNTFTNYNTSNSGIGVDMLNKVAVAGTTVWLSTYGYGIIRYNGTTFTNFNTNQQGMPNNTATSIATDGQGTLWMASSSGLSKFNGSTWTTYNTSNSQLWSNSVTSVAVDASNNIWISAGGMLQKFNNSTFTTVSDGVMSILKITTTGIYVNTGDGIGKVVNNQLTDLYWPDTSCLASCSINAAGLDEANNVWLGLDSCDNYAGGVQNFTNCITYTTSNSGLAHNSITSLHVVDSNVIWAGTLEGGLVRMNKTDSPPCNAPTQPYVAQFGQNSAYLAWMAANPAPANGYLYRYSTVNNVAQGIEGSTSQPGAGIDQLQPNTNYYWWVASACEPLNWVSGGSFTTEPEPAASGCTSATYGLFPETTFTPACTGSNEQIAPNTWAGEYSNINAVANKQYTFTSSVATDFITVTNTTGTVVYASGQTPLNWASGATSGVIRYYIHANANCGSQESSRIRYIKCDAAAATCGVPTALSVTNITSNSSRLNWSAPATAPASYDLYIVTANTAPTSNTTATVNSTTAGIGVLSGLAPSTTYYYWIRSNCGATKSAWVSGGSFTTIAALTCNGASNGLYPDATFTPACTSSSEQIVADAYAGEYSNVNALDNKQYTFTSSVATDYITITNANGTIVYASGQTPLNWSSGNTSGIIRYYLHNNANCGSQESSRIRYIKCTDAPVQTCAPPTSLAVSNITSNSVRLDWNAPATAPNSYEVYVAASNTAPTDNTPATITTGATNTRISGNLLSSTTYYYWVRSNCGSSKSAWVSGGSFTTIASLSCNGALYGLYPSATFTPSCTGANEQIVANAWGGEYSNVNVIANKQYTFTSSVATDYITITNASGTTVLASGLTPLVWNSDTTVGIVRYHLHANANCGNQNTDRVRSVKCANAPVVVCGMPGVPSVTNITSNSARIWWTAPTMAPSNYDVYISTNSTWPEYNANPTASPMSSILVSYSPLASSTTYYYWVRSVCGTAKSDWVAGGNFTTLPALTCNGAMFGLYPEDTFVLQNTGSPEAVAYQSMAGQYSNVSVAANKQYQFTSSIATDYITITNQAGTVTLASGPTPLTWTSGNAPETVRFYIHANANCGPDDMPRDKFVKATTLGVNDYLADSHFKVYPNPTMGQFSVDTGNTIADKIMIFDNVGRIISTHVPAAAKTTLAINSLSEGIYHVKVYYHDSSTTCKLVLKKN